MASLQTITAVISRIGAATAAHPNRVAETRDAFHAVLGHLTDAAVIEAGRLWIEEEEHYPKPVQLRRLAESRVRAVARRDSAPSCGNCTEGWREVAVHFQRSAGAPVEVGIRARVCDCAAGDGIGGGPGEQRRLKDYLAWIDSGRCDRNGRRAPGKVVRVVVDPAGEDRLGDADLAIRARQIEHADRQRWTQGRPAMSWRRELGAGQVAQAEQARARADAISQTGWKRTTVGGSWRDNPHHREPEDDGLDASTLAGPLRDPDDDGLQGLEPPWAREHEAEEGLALDEVGAW